MVESIRAYMPKLSCELIMEDEENNMCILDDVIGLHDIQSSDWNANDASSKGQDWISDFVNFRGYLKKHQIKSRHLKLVDSDYIFYPEKLKTFQTAKDVSKFQQEHEVYVPGVEIHHQILLPGYSQLTHKDMSQLFHYLYKLKHKIPIEASNAQNFEQLMTVAKLDYSRFQEYVKLQWIKFQFARASQVPESVLKFIDVFWKAKTKKCLSLYPMEYTFRADIPLVLNDPNKDYAVFDYVAFLRTTGKSPRMFIPPVRQRCDLLTSFDDLCSIKPISIANTNQQFPSEKAEGTSDQSSVTLITRQILTASEDGLAEQFWLSNDVDVVMTASGIKTIVDSYSLKDWILPIKVISAPHPKKPETNKKVVVIDKAMPPNSMSVHEKNLLHSKLAAKWALILNRNKNLLTKKDITKSTDSEAEKGDQPGKINLKKKIFAGPCVAYKIWNLHKATHNNMIKCEQRSLRILLRNRQEGILTHYSTPDRSRSSEEVCVSSKVEFQPEYGASVMSKSELVREYVDLYLRPNVKLVRVRTVGYSQEVMLCELCSMTDVRNKLIQSEVSPITIFDPLYAVLTKLIDLPEGKYLLRRTANMGHFAQLLQSNEKGANLNLDNFLSELKLRNNVIPPVLIDPLTLTGIHHKYLRPPAVLKPTSTKRPNNNSGLLRPAKRLKMGKISKKNRRKKLRKKIKQKNKEMQEKKKI